MREVLWRRPQAGEPISHDIVQSALRLEFSRRCIYSLALHRKPDLTKRKSMGERAKRRGGKGVLKGGVRISFSRFGLSDLWCMDTSFYFSTAAFSFYYTTA